MGDKVNRPKQWTPLLGRSRWRRLRLQDGDDHGADGVVVEFAGEHAVVGFTGFAAAGELELALSPAGLGGMSLRPGSLIEIVALDVYLLGVVRGGLAHEEAVIRVELPHRREVLDRLDLRRAGLKHLQQKAAG